MSWKERFSSLASQVTETVAPIVREALEETTNPDNYLLDDYVPSDEEEHEQENPKWKLPPTSTSKDTLAEGVTPEGSLHLETQSDAVSKDASMEEEMQGERASTHEERVATNSAGVEEEYRNQSVQLERELAELRTRCAGYEEQLMKKANAEAEVVALEQQLNERVGEFAAQEEHWERSLQQVQEEREGERLEAEKRMLELSKKAEQLAAQVEGLEASREELTVQLKELQESEEFRESAALAAQNSDTSLNLKETKGVEERLERDNQAAEIARVSNELQLEAEKNSLLEAENSRLKEELEALHSQSVPNDEAEREALRDQVTKLEEELRSSVKEVDALKLERSEFQNEARGNQEEGLIKQLEESTKEKIALEKALADAVTEQEALVAGWNAEKLLLSQELVQVKARVHEKDAALVDAAQVSKQLQQAKLDLSEMASEKEALEQIKERLQSELNAKQKDHGINRSTVSGQLEEIDKLRRAEGVLRSEIASLKEELSLHAESQQHVNKLSAELAATSADLRVAEADRDRQVIELENLTDALEALEKEVLERKRKVQVANRQVSELQQQLDTVSLEKVDLLAQVSSAGEALKASEAALEEANQENVRLNSQVRELSELVSLHQDEVNKEKNTAGEGDSDTASAATNEQEVLKTSIVKKLLLTYFSNEQANKSQVLVLIANVMGMTEEEKEKIGIVGGKVLRTRDQIKDRLDSLLTRSSPIITRVLFGPQEQESKPPVDWDAIEKVASEKTFADLLTEFVANDI